MKQLALALAVLIGLAAPAWADFQDGVAAYKSGDYAVASRELRPLAESGDMEAQLYLAQMYYVGTGVPQDFAEAAKWFLKSAEEGYDDAQFWLGHLYLRGEGVPKNPSTAANWFRKVAEHYSKIGWAHPAQLQLGIMYETGKGVPQDYREALKLYEAAAHPKVLPTVTMPAFGYSNVGSGAQLRIGILYYQGNGVPQDYREAAKRFRLAADQGEPVAQGLLGNMYLNGEGLLQDYALALRYSLMSAKQGIAAAQAKLGVMYFSGLGVPKENVIAHMWFNLAAAGGFSPAAKLRDGIAKSMTPAQIEEAQRLAREWKPKKERP